MSDMIISGPKVYTEDGILRDAAITIQDGMIADMMPAKTHDNSVLTFPSSYSLIPGFIDLHVHGANDRDVMDATLDALTVLSKTLAVEGTTSFLATTMTAPPQQIENALAAVHAVMQESHKITGAAVLGVHLEGPFISAKKAGAQYASAILPPDYQRVQAWQKKYDHIIKLVTLAPELPGSLDLIRFLREHHIVASMGHTDATFAEANDAIKEGCRYTTHLFNAMRGIHQREPGIVTAALLSDKVKTELIVDGIHLHPAIVELVLKTKGLDHIVLATDAMRAKCLGKGTYDLGGQAVHVENGVAKLADGTLAGSVLKMPDAIRNMVNYTGCDLSDAIKMASENPAKVLGIFDKKGSIALDKDADLVVLDEDFCVVMTMVKGQVVYQVR